MWGNAHKCHLDKLLKQQKRLSNIVTIYDIEITLTIISSKAISLRSLRAIWSEWRLTVIAATVRIALVDILDLSEVDIPARVFLHPAVGWG